MELEKEIEKIRRRNKKVEGDKAWETSAFRMVTLVVFTYIVAFVFLWISDFEKPWLGAIVPAIGFFLSTLTLPPLKKWWIKKFFK